jgi:glutaredoxin-related protein
VRVFKSEHTDSRHAGCGSGEVYGFQCAGGPGFARRYVTCMRSFECKMRVLARCGTLHARSRETQHTDTEAGIKEYSEWPTIPQLYVEKEFIGGCDILMSMHQDGSLAKMLEEKGVVVPAEGEQKP